MRARILAAALELFAKDGFDGATVRRIAEECGITDAALYYYFPSKRAILDALLEGPRATAAARRRVDDPLSREGLEALVCSTLDEIAAEGPLFRVILDQAIDGDRTALALRAQTASEWKRALTVMFARAGDPDFAADRADAFMMLIHGAVLSLYIDDNVGFDQLAHRADARARVAAAVVAALGRTESRATFA